MKYEIFKSTRNMKILNPLEVQLNVRSNLRSNVKYLNISRLTQDRFVVHKHENTSYKDMVFLDLLIKREPCIGYLKENYEFKVFGVASFLYMLTLQFSTGSFKEGRAKGQSSRPRTFGRQKVPRTYEKKLKRRFFDFKDTIKAYFC